MDTRHAYSVSYAVASTGNTKALLLNLFSVLNALALPKAIRVRLEGPFPSTSEFYLEQAAELARFRGVDFSLHVCKSTNIRDTRDWMLDGATTDILWMGDDDVVYSPKFLDHFWSMFANKALDFVTHKVNSRAPSIHEVKTWGWICGSKGDLNNRRGYADFNVKVENPGNLPDGASFNHFYDEETFTSWPEIKTLDTGCVFFHVNAVRQSEAHFRMFPVSTNCGGEDTLFALALGKAGLKGYMFPGCRAYHLEKPNINFNEFAARGEMILRVSELKGYDKTALKEFMPWLNLK